jgi:hypothetical protein
MTAQARSPVPVIQIKPFDAEEPIRLMDPPLYPLLYRPSTVGVVLVSIMLWGLIAFLVWICL